MTGSLDAANDGRVRVTWVAVASAVAAGVSYLFMGLGMLGTGDAEGPPLIVYTAATCYVAGGLLIPMRRRWMWIVGAAVNGLVLLVFYQAYLSRPLVLFSPGGLVSKAAELLLEFSLLYLIIEDWLRAQRRAGAGAPRIPAHR